MPPLQPYLSIAQQSYTRYITDSARITNQQLRSYFDACFGAATDHFGVYPAWTCVRCMEEGRHTYGWGQKPPRCPNCNDRRVFEIATFNARAPIVGKAFSAALSQLMRQAFRVPIHETPGNTTTHDFEITSTIAIEAKGSPSHITNPDGTRYQLGRPGMERSDTEKKAFANARTFRQRNPAAYFAILTNALPPRLLNYRNDTVSGVFNVTRREEIDIFIRDIEERVDLEALRRREFG